MNHTFIGSQLWLPSEMTMEQIAQDVHGMREVGLEVARVFLTRDTVVRRGEYNFSFWDDFFAICRKEGMKVCVTLSAFSGTGETPFGAQPTLESWEINTQRVLEYVEKVVTRYRDEEAVDCWILQNEPAYNVSPAPWSVEAFRQFLAIEYSKEELKKRYHSEDTSHIGWISPDGQRARVPGVNEPGWSYELRVDWIKFNRYWLNKRLIEVQKVVESIDTNHLTTVNAAGLLTGSPRDGGTDVFALGEIVDFMSCSAHVSWHSTRFAENRIHQSVAMLADITRSASKHPDGLFWMAELQSGTNYFSGGRPMCPTGDQLKMWLWESIGTGAQGIVYWLYRARPSGFEAMEWGLLNQRGLPSERALASKAVSDVLNANEELFNSVRPKSYDALILYGTDASILTMCEGNKGQPGTMDLGQARNVLMTQDSRCGAYSLLQDIGLDVGFINETQIEKIANLTVPYLVVPHVYALDSKVLEAISAYVNNGGTLIVDGLFAVKTPSGNHYDDSAAKIMAELFGECMDDFRVDVSPIEFSMTDHSTLPGWFLTCEWANLPADVEVLGVDSNNKPSILSRKVGKGRTLYIGTQMFQNYFRTGGAVEEYRNWLSKQIEMGTLYSIRNQSAEHRRKVLSSDQGDLIVLMNYGASITESLNLGEYTSVKDITSGETFSAAAGWAEIPMASESVRLLWCEKKSK